MSRKEKASKKKQRIIILLMIILLLLLLTLFLFVFKRDNGNGSVTSDPTLTVETPQKLSLADTDTFSLDVLISSLGKALYPAASMSISFDPSTLEFLGIDEGNVFVHNYGGESRVDRLLPDWSVNIEQSNKSGLINILYLDITGGRNSFGKDLLAEDYNVVFRLRFRLRGSARVGDIYDIIVEDAVFAASDETQSLAMTTGTLKIINSKIVIGE